MASLRKRLEEIKDMQKSEEIGKTAVQNKSYTIDPTIEESISDLSKIFPQESYHDIKKFVLQFSNRFEMNETVQTLLEEGRSIRDHQSSWNLVKSRDKKNKPAKYDQRSGRNKPRGSKYARPQTNQQENTTQERAFRPRAFPSQSKLPTARPQEAHTESQPVKNSGPNLLPAESSAIPDQPPKPEPSISESEEVSKEAPHQLQNYDLDFPSALPAEIRSDIIEEDLTLENKYSLYDEQQEANFKGVNFQVSKRTGDYERSLFSSAFQDEVESGCQTESRSTREVGVQTENISSGINCTICPMSAEDLEKFAGFWDFFKKPSI
jgi:hypothetical protein